MTQKTEKEEAHQNVSRREFIKTTTLAAGAVSTFASCSRPTMQDTDVSEAPSEDLPLSAAGYNFKRLEALFDGHIRIEGCDTHSLRHSFESVAFSIAPGLAGALTGRALTRDAVLNTYIHVDQSALMEVADKVAGRIAQSMAGELAEVVAIESRRG